MKKQNVNNKLAFNKAAVIELNDNSLNAVNGGSSLGCALFAVELYVEVTLYIHNEYHK